jgi:hypothetical protein
VLLGVSEGDNEGLKLGLSVGFEEGTMVTVGADVAGLMMGLGDRVLVVDTGASVGDTIGMSVGAMVG